MTQQLREQARELAAQMTLEEKASLCSGKNFWESKAVERLGIKSFMLTDGPHGLRKQAGAADHLGLNASVPATCFPPAAATACSFDRALLREIGQAMGRECRAEEVGVILGPAANIKRSPLCGRNFEYFSEDPLVTGESAAGLIEGIQSQNVGACMKHYLANNQEKARLVSNSVVDGRALREIYLAGFEKAVKEAQPWTLMCSYNQINGAYASDHKELMTDVPRGQWGFEGAIMTDWGAMNDRVEAIQAGLDLEMPGPCDGNDEKIVQAVREGRLDEKLVDACAARMVELAPGESKTVELTLDRRAFAYYDAQAGNWRVDSGTYTVEIGSSSRDIRLTQTVKVQGAAPNTALNEKVPAYCDPARQWPAPREQFEAVLGHPVPPARSVRPFTINSTLGEIQTTPAGMAFIQQAKANMAQLMGSGEDDCSKMIDAMLEDMPLRQLAMLSGGTMTPAVLDGLVEMLNGASSAG